MVFSSIPFLFFAFPIFFFIYYLLPKKSYKNAFLLGFSLLFYAWGEPIYIFLMLFTTLSDYILVGKMKKNPSHKKKYFLMSLIIDLGLLGIFKYSDFLIGNINQLFHTSIPLLKLSLPIGISFYTFQTLSYVMDVYREKVEPADSYGLYLTYVSMFPQLIAGPIVRYETIEKELKERKISYSDFNEGIMRFLRGFFKKVLLANQIGLLWTTIKGIPTGELSMMTSWLGVLAFTFQIYFDFSAYSDMAIGMGRMLGFHFLENFNYPYISKSITEFWRRWHISLSSWFKDYVYIPLGGNKTHPIRNLFVVWILTGLWHGASWNFLLWGIYYGILLFLEKYFFQKQIQSLPKWGARIYMFFFVMIGWMIFGLENISNLLSYSKVFFGLTGNLFDSSFLFYLKNYFVLLFFCFLFSTPILTVYKEKIKKVRFSKTGIYFACTLGVYLILFFLSVACLVSDSYNPFLYFRF